MLEIKFSLYMNTDTFLDSLGVRGEKIMVHNGIYRFTIRLL